jgi:acyl-CoA oxidase
VSSSNVLDGKHCRSEQYSSTSLQVIQLANPSPRLSTNHDMADFTDHLKPAHNGTATLQAERDGSDIDVHQLAQHLLGRDGFLERQEKVLRILSKEKLFNKEKQLNLSRPERYHLGLARAKAIQRLMRREGWDHEDYKMAEYLTDEMSPYHLHMSMFGESTETCS